ncbi:transposon Tf2-1 polyprotein [Cryptomeria japonica]|uniref:transposon Tf2-1 polyprotein n=1 Tax=Cryptomeria japonica TaxID=3369 RepID=UPI0027DA26F8|nr:transposon Tf2-1 polyprotein [Cryptomeria japonica]
MVGDDWSPVLKAAAFKIFLEYKDVFAWTYKDLKGVPPELCVHRIPLMQGARPVRKCPYRMNKNYAAKISIAEEDKLKTTFIVEDGVFAYNRMPFGLCNAPATFQRIILHIFDKMATGNFKAFLDDWFLVPQGRLLGHIVCKAGLKTDPDKIRVILDMDSPTDVTGIKSFLGHVGYYQQFIKGFAEVSLPLERLTRKGEPFVWDKEQNEAFQELKTRLVRAPILAYPNWENKFHVHVDASNFAIGAILTQPGSSGLDHPIYFARRLLSKAERNYSTTEREALGTVYVVQKFRHYLLATPFTFFVDHQALMYLVNKPVIQGRVSRWLILLQEFTFNVVVRPGKSHVMANHLSRIKSGEPGEEGVNEDFPDGQLFKIAVLPSWYEKLGQYLSTATIPGDMSPSERRKLALKSTMFQLIQGLLYKLGPDGILRRCVLEEEIPRVLRESHEGLAGGHMGPDTTAQKILLAGLWWPTLYADAREWVTSCDTCQRAGKPLKRDFMPLFPSQPQELFERWGLDFVEPMRTSKVHRCHYIVVAIEYLTKWAEARALPDNTALSTTKFLYEHIVTRFRIPLQLTSDRGVHFVNQVIRNMTTEFKIFHTLSSPYYPRANGQAESTNKVLVSILYKTCGVEQGDWEERLPAVLWAYRTTYKATTTHTPFQLMYGQEVVMPVEYTVPTLRIAVQNRWGDEERLMTLQKLDERHLIAQWAIEVAQNIRKAWHDKHLRRMKFSPGQLVLKYNGRNELRPVVISYAPKEFSKVFSIPSSGDSAMKPSTKMPTEEKKWLLEHICGNALTEEQWNSLW